MRALTLVSRTLVVMARIVQGFSELSEYDRSVLVRSAADCNVAWAQRIADRHVEGGRVHRVDTLAHHAGTTTHLRLQVHHDVGASLPSHWFVKTAPSHVLTRLLVCTVGLLENEARFYTRFAANVPVQVPECLAAAATRFSGIVVLHDLSASGLRPGQANDVLSLEQVRGALHALAALHAYGQQSAIRRDWHQNAHAMRLMEERLGNWFSPPLTRRGLKRAGQAVPARLHAPALEYARRRSAYQTVLRKAPHTLVHHDCHPGNWYWHQSRPGLLDWQLCRLGEGIGDVAYLLSTSLPPELLAEHEDALLQLYAEALIANGSDLAGGMTRLARRYRMHLAYAFEAMLMTVAIGGFMPAASSMELVRRTANAVDRNFSLTAADLWGD